MDSVEAAVLDLVQQDLRYGDLTVQQARLMLLSATVRPLRGEEVARLIRLLDGMSRDIRDDATLFRTAAQLAEARTKGNSSDLWRAIGKIEAIVAPRGVTKEISGHDDDTHS